jgi:ribosome-associated heat shock protein Hsp15
MQHPLESVRLDKWLWAARFFKTRSMATEAVSGGRVHLNGNRSKPAHPLRVGDRLSITIGPYQFDVQVLALNELRRPASEARLLYEESAESIAQRQRQRELKKMADGGFSAPDRRPGKRDRRKIRDFTGKN